MISSHSSQKLLIWPIQISAYDGQAQSTTCSSLCCGISDPSWEVLKLMDLTDFNPLYDLGKGQDLQIFFLFVMTQVPKLRKKPSRGKGETSPKQKFLWKNKTALPRKVRGEAFPVTLLMEKQENFGHKTGTKAKEQS